MKIFYIMIIIFLYISNSFSKSYELEWTGDIEFTKSITYQDKSIFKIVHPIGYWKDSDGNFGNFSCVGSVSYTHLTLPTMS